MPNPFATINFTVTFPHPATVFGISVNGVQPLFLIRHLLHVPDRNVLSKICSPTSSEADAYWISQLNSPEVTFNPIFTAAEGPNRTTPSQAEFVEQYLLAETAIKTQLPLASFIPHNKESLTGSYALVEELADRRSRETAFLIECAPLVVDRLPTKQLAKVESVILSSAIKHGLAGGSLSLLAVLSCLYENSQGVPPAPGRGVLHPKVAYTAHMAHNCLSDLLAIELLVASSSLGIGQHAFITADKNLARFWQSISPKPTDPVGGKATATFQLSTKLLHRIDECGLERLASAFAT